MTRPQTDCGDRLFYNSDLLFSCMVYVFDFFWCRIIMHVSCQWCKSQTECDMIVQTAHTLKKLETLSASFCSDNVSSFWGSYFPSRTEQCLMPNSWVSQVVAETSSDRYPSWAGRSSDLIPMKASGVSEDGRLLPSNKAEAPSFFTDGEHAKMHKLSLKV